MEEGGVLGWGDGGMGGWGFEKGAVV